MLCCVFSLRYRSAQADEATPGYSERVIQWSVQEEASCADIAKVVYGSASHIEQVQRYNEVDCAVGASIPAGTTLVLPEKVTNLPTAQLKSLTPTVHARPPGGGWGAAGSGMSLFERYGVHTLGDARADIRFRDRSRVVLSENTLVVIYRTAAQTNVRTAEPKDVELQEGEVAAGLAALRGRPLDVAIGEGRSVRVRSRDTVLRRHGARTTVSVFDGESEVRAAQQQVVVHRGEGSAVIGDQPPTAPRPLPSAPEWGAASSRGIVVVAGNLGGFEATWSAVPSAVGYRFEAAHDPAFEQLVAREEVPARVTRFAAQAMPPGHYYLRVRAIDDEDFLGMAADALQVTVVGVEVLPHGKLEGGTLRASPYATLRFLAPDDVKLVEANGVVTGLSDAIELIRRPAELRLQSRGATASLPVEYDPLDPWITAKRQGDSVVIALELRQPGAAAVLARVAPSLVIGTRRFALEADAAGLRTVVPVALADEARVDAIDGSGRLLGSVWLPRLVEPEHVWALPALVPPVSLSPALSVGWWSPRVRSHGAAVGSVALIEGNAVGQIQLRGAGAFGPFAVDATLDTESIGGDLHTSAAWLGLRWRAVELRQHELALGPALRVGLPTVSTSPPPRVDIGFGVGGNDGALNLLGNIGARLATSTEQTCQERACAAPKAQGAALFGASYALLGWLQGYALLDAHLLRFQSLPAVPATTTFRGGLSLGLEGGGVLFGGVGVRASPWSDLGGYAHGHLTIGVREP